MMAFNLSALTKGLGALGRPANLMSLSGVLAGLAFGGSIMAQTTTPAAVWPNKPVKLIVPFPAGGGTDAFTRPLARVLTQTLGQSFVIDNRGGAGGTLGAEVAAKSPADGYTFLVGAVHHTIAVSMYPKLGYDLQKDLVPITVLSYVPNVVVVNPQRVPSRTFPEFAQYMKKNPGKLNFGSAGNGTTHHLTVEQYKTATKSFAIHVPYRGAGPAMQDLLAGQIDFMFDGLGTALPQIKAGKIVPLAVTSAKRSFALPNVPTLAEAGVAGYEAQTWYGVWAPANTPKEITLRLQTEITKALNSSELKEVWKNLGAEAGGQTSEEMAKFIQSEIGKWAKVVKESGAKLD
jgi:tripartite-type tricarboxylate transporter receptor subunit TctC